MFETQHEAWGLTWELGRRQWTIRRILWQVRASVIGMKQRILAWGLSSGQSNNQSGRLEWSEWRFHFPVTIARLHRLEWRRWAPRSRVGCELSRSRKESLDAWERCVLECLAKNVSRVHSVFFFYVRRAGFQLLGRSNYNVQADQFLIVKGFLCHLLGCPLVIYV